MSGVSTPETEALTTGKKGSKLVKIAGALLVLLVVLAAGVFFAGPMIGASIAKSAIARTTEDGTTVTVDKVSLSWGGPQRLTGVSLHTPDGHDAKIDATLDASLVSLILTRGKGDLGTATVTGAATINADALQPAADSSNDPSNGPTDLPQDWTTGEAKPIELGDGFALNLNVERVDLEVTSAVSPPIVGVLTAAATAKAGEPTTMNATLEMTPQGRPTGTATLSTTLTGLIPASGTVSTSAFETETSLVIDRLATELIGLVQRGPGIPGLPTDLDLARALGPTLDAELTTTARVGDDPSAQTKVMVSSSNLRVVSHTSLASGRLTQTGDNAVSVNTAQLDEAWPALADWLSAQGLTVTGSPQVTLTLDSLDWPTGKDWRTARGEASVNVTQTGLTLPAGALGETPAAVELSPTLVTLALDGDSLAIVGTLRSSIDGTAAGVLDLDLTAERFLSAGGALALTRVPAVSGTATLTDAPAALLQTLLAADSPILVARDVGPSITATLVAESSPGAMTIVALDARADNLAAKGSFTLDGALVQNQPAAETRVTLNRLTPTLAALLEKSAAVTPLTDGGAILNVQMLTLDLDALARGGLFGENTLNLHGDYRLAPLSASLAPSEQPVALAQTTGTFSIIGPTITTRSTLGNITLGESADAATGVTIESTTTMPRRSARPDAQPGSPITDAKIVAGVIRTAALGEWLGAEGGAGKALVGLDDRMKLESEPRLADGLLMMPFALDGTDLDITGVLSSQAGSLTGDVVVDVTSTTSIDRAMGLADGLAGELLGSSAEIKLSLLPQVIGENSPPPVAGTLNAMASVTSERLETNGRVRIVSSPESLSIPEPFTMHAELTPRAFALLNPPADGEAALTLGQPTGMTLQVNAFTLPKGEGAALSMDALVSTGPLTIQRTGEAAREFSGLSAQLKSVDGSPGDVSLLATLDEGGRPVVRADVVASGAVNEAGAFAPAAAGFTGTVTLAQAQTELLDMLAGTKVLANLLGPTTDADLRLANFPRDGGTIDGTVTGPRASGTIHALSSGGTITLAEPAVFELREITQAFSYQFTPLLPVVGALTKSPTADRPATVTVQSLSMPVKFDVASLGFDATIDVGTASIVAENDLTAMLRGRPSIGNRFAPFNASMTGGVLSVTGLTVPIGEFMVPATGSYNLASKSEDVSVQLPAAALLAEAIGGGKQGAIGQVLGDLINVSLHKSGSLGAKNAWKVETSSPLDGGKPTDEQIRKGLNDLLNIFGR